MTIRGYTRVSTEEQNHDLQLEALRTHGVTMFYQDTDSGGKFDRIDLQRLLQEVQPGDTVVVWKIDRLGRSLQHLLQIMAQFLKQGVTFVSTTEGIDTTTSVGMLVFQILASLAEFERALIRERTNAGLRAARLKGNRGGHPRVKQSKIEAAMQLRKSGEQSVRQICDVVGISEATLYRYLALQEKMV